jgi:hypothetical protein
VLRPMVTHAEIDGQADASGLSLDKSLISDK